MATIQTTIQITDQVTPVLQNITAAMHVVLNTFEQIQKASQSVVNTSDFTAVKNELAQVNSILSNIDSSINQSESAQDLFNQRLQQAEDFAGLLSGTFKGMAAVQIAMASIKFGTERISGYLQAAGAQLKAETQLETVMRQRMNANYKMIDSVKSLLSAQQRQGVISDEVAMSGAQQLATFLQEKNSLETLIPAMENLAAKQKGFGASAEDLYTIGNLMGKAMQGQVGELNRLGITFDTAQAQILKYGNEQQRAATLAQAITSHVGQMNTALLSMPEGQIANLGNYFGDIEEEVGYQLYPAIMRFFDIIRENMPNIRSLMLGVGTALGLIVQIGTKVVSVMNTGGRFIAKNWELITSVLLTILAPLALYRGIMLGIAVAHFIATTSANAFAVVTTLLSIGMGVLRGNTAAASAAVLRFNSALLANPIVWVIGIIIILIGVLYIVVAVINEITGKSISATGIIVGAVYGTATVIQNVFRGIANLVAGLFNLIWNVIVTFIEFFVNIFIDPITAVQRLFIGLGDTVLSVLKAITKGLDAVFGTNMTAGIEEWRNNLHAMADKDYGVQKFRIQRDPVDYFKHIDVTQRAELGYREGEQFVKSVKGFFKLPEYKLPELPDQPGLFDNGMRDDVAKTAENTSVLKDSVTMNDEMVKLLRQMAEQQTINRFTTADVRLEMRNDVNLSSDMDIDGFVNRIEQRLTEALYSTAEGVHI